MKKSFLILALMFVTAAVASYAQDAGGPPREGQGGGGRGGPRGLRLLPPRAQEQLNLTDEQQQKITALEAELKTKFEKILTPEQLQKMQQQSPQPRQDSRDGGNLRSDNPPPRERAQEPSANERPQRAEPMQVSNVEFPSKPKNGFVLRSSAMSDGGAIPKEFTGDGESISPPLEWAGAPAGTTSYALIMHHTDARGDNISYWVLYNIPASVQSLPKNVKNIGTLGLSSRARRPIYTPPHSAGPGTRTYVFTLYALSAPPQLAASPDGVSHAALIAAMQNKILASADLSVTYTRYTVANASVGQSEQPQQRDSERPRREMSQTSGQNSDQSGGQQRQRRVSQQDGPQNSEQQSERPQRDGNRQGDGQSGQRDGERRPGGGGRVTENNKTPASPNPGQTVGVFLNTPQACPGYTLLAPKHNTNIYLIANSGQIVHQWHSQFYPGQSVYLKPNGNLLHCCQVRNRSFTGGGEGGRIEEFDWDGKLIWEFWYSSDTAQQHHDIAPMPNGNILMLVVEKKTAADCLAAGWPADMMNSRELYPEAVVEIQPIYPNGGKIVWQWSVWDHMIQNYDRSKPNYGDPAAHPELIYMRGGPGGRGPTAFWNHANSINYNPKLDQITISARGNSEIWFLDHSTSTAQAAGHTGGKHGKGGDLIYRWGNPSAYLRGNERDAQLNQQHDGEWIPEGYPGAGHVTIFNNGYNRGYTSIEEIVPPLDANGHYILEAGKAFGPDKPVWHYEAKNRTDFFSSEISGAHRLPNGNTLICAGVIGHLFEVTPAGEMVWQFVNPAVRGGTLAQGEVPGKDVRGHLFNAVFKAHRYAPDYPGLKGRDLTPKGVIELPADQKGKTGLDQADAQPGERPPEVGFPNPNGGGDDRGQVQRRQRPDEQGSDTQGQPQVQRRRGGNRRGGNDQGNQPPPPPPPPEQ